LIVDKSGAVELAEAVVCADPYISFTVGQYGFDTIRVKSVLYAILAEHKFVWLSVYYIIGKQAYYCNNI